MPGLMETAIVLAVIVLLFAPRLIASRARNLGDSVGIIRRCATYLFDGPDRTDEA